MRFLVFSLIALFCTNVQALEFKDTPKTPENLKIYTENADKILSAVVRIELGDSPLGGAWTLSQTQLQVFIGKLQRLKSLEHPYDSIFAQIDEPSKRYGGLELSFNSSDSKLELETLVFYGGKIKTKNGKMVFDDPGRLIEYWLWGTAQTRTQQQIGLNVLNVFAFDQCVQLNHTLIETDPRQCLMPNTIVMLDLGEMPTADSLKISDFEQCLISGTAIIDSFPRRCMAAGGKLFAEPPRRPDGQLIPDRAGFTEF